MIAVIRRIDYKLIVFVYQQGAEIRLIQSLVRLSGFSTDFMRLKT